MLFHADSQFAEAACAPEAGTSAARLARPSVAAAARILRMMHLLGQVVSYGAGSSHGGRAAEVWMPERAGTVLGAQTGGGLRQWRR
ncbi:hypothetical protein GCM10009802_13060 [Streptomyces synnematoformans]|uniref:Uncharacterized protein n=1 Tax=Streptomyces synnematoformans TaxID=415721 RepID=A0ABN2XKQ6_9ACTN